MSVPDIITIIVALLGSSALTVLFNSLANRRKNNIEADRNESELIKDYQQQIAALFDEKIALKEQNSNLRVRLGERDAQLVTVTQHLDAIRGAFAKSATTDQVENLSALIKHTQELIGEQTRLIKDSDPGLKAASRNNEPTLPLKKPGADD